MSKKKTPIKSNVVRSGSQNSFEKERDNHIITTRKFFRFVQEVMGFYTDNKKYITEINTLTKLEEINKKAEDYFMEIIKENEKQAEENHKKIIQAISNFDLGEFPPKKKHKRISRFI